MISRPFPQTSKTVVILGLILAFLAAALVMFDVKPFGDLDRMSYDFMLNLFDRKPVNNKVLIIDIDEPSLARYGQWPWPRHLVARMLDVVGQGGPDFVGIDILFAEPDRSSLGPLSRELKARFGLEIDTARLPAEMIDHDAALARTLQSGPFSLGLMFRFNSHATSKIQLPVGNIKTIEMARHSSGPTPLPMTRDLVEVVPQLLTAADGLGFVNILLDSDGVIRRAPLFIRYNNTFVPSLGLLAFLRSQNNRSVVLESGPTGMICIRAGTSVIPVDRQGNLLLAFRGGARTYATLSAAALLDGSISSSLFTDKVVFLGSSAEGLMDNHPTPFGRHFPGVEVHATVAGALLDGDLTAVPAWTRGARGVGAFLLVLLATAAVVGLPTHGIGVVLGGFFVIIPLGAMALFNRFHLFIPPGSTMTVHVLSFAVLALARFRSEEIFGARRERLLTAARDCAMIGLVSLAETRDTETGRHIVRTQLYVQALAQYLSRQGKKPFCFTAMDIDLLVKSAPLHDIGKVGIPDSILLKPGRLTTLEFDEMKKHTQYGEEALAKAAIVSGNLDETSFLKTAREIALTHHEKWDGTGYPRGLKQEEIPPSGRLMALADVYDALTSKRVYKDAMGHAEALAIIREGSGSHFDSRIVDAFLALESTFCAIAEKYIDESLDQ